MSPLSETQCNYICNSIVDRQCRAAAECPHSVFDCDPIFMRVTVVKKKKQKNKSTSFLLQIHLIFNELGSQLCCFFFLHLLLSFKRRPHTKNARALQENKQKQCLCSGFCCQTYSHRAPAAAQPVVCVCVCV